MNKGNDLTNEVNTWGNVIEKIREKIVDLLQEDFEGIYEFFQDLRKDKYDFVVIMSRRCLVLYQIFLRFFILLGEIKECVATIISDQAIPYYIDKMENKKIVIVDDILIHGRTISKFYQMIEGNCKDVEIGIAVYMADKDINCMSDRLKKKVKSKCVAHKGEWRSLSNKIVGSIFVANEPYTSFVTSHFKYENQEILALLKNMEGIMEEINTSQMQEKFELTSKFIYEEERERPEIFQWISAGEGVRIYSNESTDKITLIPYVFVRNMSFDENFEVLQAIAQVLPDSMPNIKCAMMKREKDAKFIEYQARMLTCILSSIYWLDFIERNSLNQGFHEDIDTLEKSFGKEISEEFDKIDNEIAKRVLELPFRQYSRIYATNVKEELIEELSKILDEEFQKESKLEDIAKNYFQNAWYVDERRAELSQSRYVGVALDTFIKKAEQYGKNKQELLAVLVGVWDNGLATANYVANVEKEAVGCYITPGEQSYKIIIEKYPSLIKMLVFLSKVIRVDNLKTKCGKSEVSEEEYNQYKIELLYKLIDEYDEKHQLKDADYIKEIVKHENGYLNSWNQSAILKYAMKYDDRQDNELLEKFIETNL